MASGITFPPVENGLDYLKRAAAHLHDEPDHRDLKYAILHLHAAVEVLLKVRLLREHWSLVFNNPGKATRAAFTTGNFGSIGLDDAVVRLRDIANVRLTDAARNSFKRLTDVRNKLQHFGLVEEETGVEILAGEVLDALLVFIGEHLEPEAKADEQEPLREASELIREEITRISTLVKAGMQRISSELKDKAHFIVACPGCIQLTLELGEEGEPGRCLLCEREWSDPEELASGYASAILHRSSYEAAMGNSEIPTRICPECDLETLVDDVIVRSEGEGSNWVCFNCMLIRPKGGIAQCLRCGEPILADEGSMTVCQECFEAAMERD